MRRDVRCATVWRGVRWTAVWRGVATIVGAVEIMTMIGLIAAAAVIAAAALRDEAMAAPAVGVTPAGPGAYAQEDAVVEVPRPVKAHGGAAVGCSFVVAVLADGWSADFNGNLRASRWHKGQARKQCCRAE